jgi:hypothetical protein
MGTCTRDEHNKCSEVIDGSAVLQHQDNRPLRLHRGMDYAREGVAKDARGVYFDPTVSRHRNRQRNRWIGGHSGDSIGDERPLLVSPLFILVRATERDHLEVNGGRA